MISTTSVSCRIVPQLVEFPSIASRPAPISSRVKEQISFQPTRQTVVPILVQFHFSNFLMQIFAFSPQGCIVRNIRLCNIAVATETVVKGYNSGFIPRMLLWTLDIGCESLVKFINRFGRFEVFAIPELPARVVDQLDEVASVGNLQKSQDLHVIILNLIGSSQLNCCLDCRYVAPVNSSFDLTVRQYRSSIT